MSVNPVLKGCKPGDHVLFVDGEFNLKVNSAMTAMIHERAHEVYRVRPEACIQHMMVITTYEAPAVPVVKTYAETRL